MRPSPLTPPTFRADLPSYPVHNQLLRVTGGTVPGPSGYASSSVLGPSLYIAFVQQVLSTQLPVDREPCLVLDLNRIGLAPGYYDGRLCQSHNGLPVFGVGGAAVNPVLALSTGPLGANSLTPAQTQFFQTMSSTQLQVLANLTPCQLYTIVNALPPSQLFMLTTVLTPQQIQNLINFQDSTQLLELYQQLTLSQIIELTSQINQDQIWQLTSILTPAQIQYLITNLTGDQLYNLTTYTPAQIYTIVTELTLEQLQLLLSTTPLSPSIPPSPYTPVLPTSVTDLVLPPYITVLQPTITQPTTIFSLDTVSLVPGQTIVIQNPPDSAADLTLAHDGPGDVPFIFGVEEDIVLEPGGGTVTITLAPDGVGFIATDTGVSSGVVDAIAGGGSPYSTEETLAATGSVQGDAAQISADNVEVTGGDGTKGVILKNGAGFRISVWNNSGAGLLKVYPPSGSSIANNGTNAAQTLTTSQAGMFTRITSTKWGFNAIGIVT